MTTKLPAEAYSEIWEKAAEQEIGLGVSVEPADQQKFVNALYACKQAIGGFEDIMVFQPEPAGQVWLVHKGVELPD